MSAKRIVPAAFEINWAFGRLPVLAHFGFPLSQKGNLEALEVGATITIEGRFEGIQKRAGYLVYDVTLCNSVIWSQ
jgi:hypothetical protein